MILVTIFVFWLIALVFSVEIQNLNSWLRPFIDCHLHVVTYYKNIHYSEFEAPILLEDVLMTNIFEIYSGYRDSDGNSKFPSPFVGNSRVIFKKSKHLKMNLQPALNDRFPVTQRWKCLVHILIIPFNFNMKLTGGTRTGWKRIPLPASLVNYFIPNVPNPRTMSWGIGEILRSGQYFLFFSTKEGWDPKWLNDINSHAWIGQNTRSLLFQMRFDGRNFQIQNSSDVGIVAIHSCRRRQFPTESSMRTIPLTGLIGGTVNYHRSTLDSAWNYLENKETWIKWKIGDWFEVSMLTVNILHPK